MDPPPEVTSARPQTHYPGYLWTSVTWAIVAAITGRGVMIFTFSPCMNPFLKEGLIDLRYQLISFWGSLR
jgi:hypothetical protein